MTSERDDLIRRLMWSRPHLGLRAVAIADSQLAGKAPDVQRWRLLGYPKEKRA